MARMWHGLPLLVVMMIVIFAAVVAWLGWLCLRLSRGAPRARVGEAVMERLGEILKRRYAELGRPLDSLDELGADDMESLKPLGREGLHYRPGVAEKRIL